MRRWFWAAAVLLVCAALTGCALLGAPAESRPMAGQACIAATGLVLLDGETGLYVLGVTDGSLASSAGIRPGDYLTGARDVSLSTAAQLEELLTQQGKATILPLTLVRQNQTLVVHLSLP